MSQSHADYDNGSMGYMAPELALSSRNEGKNLERASDDRQTMSQQISDVFSLGLVLMCLLTNKYYPHYYWNQNPNL